MRVIFHLVNWPRIYGSAIAWERDSEMVAGRIVLETDGWLIFLDSVRQIDELEQQLKDGASYAITHVGQIERADGGLFSEADADDLLRLLNRFFSFARGFWTPPILTVGFDAADEIVYRDWHSHLALGVELVDLLAAREECSATLTGKAIRISPGAPRNDLAANEVMAISLGNHLTRQIR